MNDELIIEENNKVKICKSKNYNSLFDKKTGFFARWGKNKEDDPICAPGCEIADIEIVSGGNCLGKCNFCSPSGTKINTPGGVKNIENLKDGDYVIGYSIKRQKPFVEKIEETYKRHYNGNLVCIELENGEVLKLTPEHIVILKNGEEKQAQNITAEDELIYF